MGILTNLVEDHGIDVRCLGSVRLYRCHSGLASGLMVC